MLIGVPLKSKGKCSFCHLPGRRAQSKKSQAKSELRKEYKKLVCGLGIITQPFVQRHLSALSGSSQVLHLVPFASVCH